MGARGISSKKQHEERRRYDEKSIVLFGMSVLSCHDCFL